MSKIEKKEEKKIELTQEQMQQNIIDLQTEKKQLENEISTYKDIEQKHKEEIEKYSTEVKTLREHNNYLFSKVQHTPEPTTKIEDKNNLSLNDLITKF